MDNTEILLDCAECASRGDLMINDDGDFVCNRCGLVDQVIEKPKDEIDLLISRLANSLEVKEEDEYSAHQIALIEMAKDINKSQIDNATVEDLLRGLTVTKKPHKRARMRR